MALNVETSPGAGRASSFSCPSSLLPASHPPSAALPAALAPCFTFHQAGRVLRTCWLLLATWGLAVFLGLALRADLTHAGCRSLLLSPLLLVTLSSFTAWLVSRWLANTSWVLYLWPQQQNCEAYLLRLDAYNYCSYMMGIFSVLFGLFGGEFEARQEHLCLGSSGSSSEGGGGGGGCALSLLLHQPHWLALVLLGSLTTVHAWLTLVRVEELQAYMLQSGWPHPHPQAAKSRDPPHPSSTSRACAKARLHLHSRSCQGDGDGPATKRSSTGGEAPGV